MSVILFLIIFLIVCGVVLYLTQMVVANLPVSPMIRSLIIALVALLLLLWLLQHFGLVPL
jgi:hypothetical protein